MKWEYLIFNGIVLLASTLGIKLFKTGKWPDIQRAMRAIGIMGVIYLVWDWWVVDWWWRFNPKYILEINFGKLPVEEILFFVTVPWSCLIIWVNIRERISGEWRVNMEGIFTIVGVIVGVWGWWQGKWYTLAVAIAVIWAAWLSTRSNWWMRKKATSVFWGITILLTLVFNGYLTARPVVIYNLDVASRLMAGTIPVEDMIYGLVLVSGVAMIYEKNKSK